MPSLADSLVSSSARALAIRKRPDLTAEKHRYQGRTYWIVKEPLALHYFRFQEEEFAILNMLDGTASLDGMKADFERDFPPQKITVEELAQFVGMLHKSGLVIADVPGQGRQLQERRAKQKRQELLGAVSNILAVRFKGIDPDRILNWLHPKVKWIFTPWAVAACAILALSALSLVLVQFDNFRAKLPSFHQFFGHANWFWLAASLGVTKVIHEFGHGTSCKHFGGECHEMGVMLLVLTPCLYCNVSDSWMLPNKWHRAIIGAAGMYIELVIASICTFLWWFSAPGLLNQICLSTMFVCSVSTVVFNANPLLRYDGYYILADLMEIPNLRQKASTILSRKLGAWCLGLEEPDDPFLPQRNQIFFALYSVAAATYRWIVLFSILWFMYKVFEPYGLKVISQAITWMALIGLVVQPLWKVGKFFYVPGRLQQVKPRRVRISLLVLAALLAFFFFVPLPYRVVCMLEVKPRDAESIYVDVKGRLEEVSVQQNDLVRSGQVLARLSSTDLDLAIEDLHGKIGQHEARLKTLERSRFDNEALAQEIPQVEELIKMFQEELASKEKDRARLTLLAPIAGTVLPPPALPKRPDAGGQLPVWSGTPLQEKNLGAFLQDGVLFCQIGDPKKMEAVLIVEQDDVEFVTQGQSVEIKLDALPHETLHSTIEEVAHAELKFMPKQLSNKSGGEVVTQTDPSGMERPQTTSFQAKAPLEGQNAELFVGLRGRAKIHANWQTLASRMWRLMTRTFNFKM